ncbi:phospholipase A2-beta-like isoform X2 [Nicotiana tomentosiformis]|uniref:phospholipase A2-beta-like isoform X2 n=1 Tax=Nicotiana tomentosiformis TaxID=4098 RepID=UPI001444A755|nr:phospholipase A2-beta-like isoform X2 [Nicotiana tomentosiformis]
MQGGDNSLTSSFILTTLVFSFFLFAIAESTNNSQGVRCSKTCVAENCNSIGIRYGKYCGVGWSGCPGEKPCDDLDTCCKIHDECVEKNVTPVKERKNLQWNMVCLVNFIAQCLIQLLPTFRYDKR